ncbi:MAG: sigma-70 family RNA polymerase sigma factor [Bacillota bacterium]|jgi:RNA polymerase sigma factor for flagellar operon FliA|nr:FliA/WhiG family RNA polymerase sigma factor [Clostridia bacterium]
MIAEKWEEFIDKKNTGLREELILHYLPLVKHILRRLVVNVPSHLDEEDLLSFGCLGLIEAVDKFNPKIGVRFETYASYRIKGKIIDEIRKANFLPRSTYKKLQTVTNAYRRLEQSEGTVTEEKWAEAAGMTLDELHGVLLNVSSLSSVSLDEVINNYPDKKTTVGELVEAADAPNPQLIIEEQELKVLLKEALLSLGERDKLILALYYNEKLTLKEIGKVLNVSESRACQLHGRAILRLKAQLEEWNN